MPVKQKNTGLILTGGGARGAYQAGVLQGIAEIAKSRTQTIPCDIISGASAGALNVGFIAATADNFSRAARQLSEFWSTLKAESVFRTDVRSLSRIGLNWATDLTLGNARKQKQAVSLVDTSPLKTLISSRVPFNGISKHLSSGVLNAVEVSALDYSTSENVSFIMSRQPRAAWVHPRRRSAFTKIKADHVMASAAIPLLFPPIEVESRFYGDGCVRNPAPLSPAIRLGARRLLIVGVRHGRNHHIDRTELTPTDKPTIARILGVVLNALVMDTVEYDIDRLTRMNKMVESVPPELRDKLPLKQIDCLAIQPSADVGEIAGQHFKRLPGMLQYLIGGMGNAVEAAELASYLLFEPSFCSYLTELGRQDAYNRRDEIEEYLFGGPR
ncbi:MAG: hypothetical protein RL011_246 [Pseudomonadota bacterium]|jgi:NTE family protein